MADGNQRNHFLPVIYSFALFGVCFFFGLINIGKAPLSEDVLVRVGRDGPAHLIKTRFWSSGFPDFREKCCNEPGLRWEFIWYSFLNV